MPNKVSTFVIYLINTYVVGAAIVSQVGTCEVAMNRVPKEHAMADIYC